MATNIVTNNQPREIIYGCELTAAERAEFDYYDAEQLDTQSFFRYRGHVYDTGEFMRVPESFSIIGWDGYTSDSYFSGVLIRYTRDMEYVVVATYYA